MATKRVLVCPQAVEECQKAGLTKHIGLSNFNKSQVTRILNSCSIRPVASQIHKHVLVFHCVKVEVSPYFSNRPILDFCKEKGMTLTAYAPLGAPNRPWHESGQPGPVFDEPILKEISASKGKSIPQVILRFHIQRGLVVIPKSITPSRIKENIDVRKYNNGYTRIVFDFQLSEEEMTKIASLDRNFRAFAEP
ncbi:ALD1-like protein, partial [Mya arenaria]